MISGGILYALPPDSTAIYYTVKKGENIAVIATKYNTTVAKIKAWNKLSSSTLRQDQKIIIGYSKVASQAIVTDDLIRKATGNDSLINRAKEIADSILINNNFKGKEFIEGGLGAWSEALDKEKYYAFHNKAPEGTIIKVTDVQSKKTVYVKVIGPITKNYTGNNIIVISRIAALKLGLDDENFVCKLSYTKDSIK